ncbi:MAG: cysteine--tRNA ligase [Limnochordia bacterium]
MSIKIYNTLTRQKETFTPREDKNVGIYVCGVTPYDETHLGHAIPSILWDVFKKFLRYRGYHVTHVQNFTDIDDKIIARAQREDKSASDIAMYYSEEYLRSMDALGVERADYYPRVSQHIPQIIEMVSTLVEKGYAYEQNGDVYFSVDKFPSYGKLSKQRLDELVEGEKNLENKRNPLDFALWKGAKPGEPAWDSPWGPGRPGWHIECSAMSLQYLEDGIDFHGGGMDLIFPHHENEIAQSEAYGIQPFVRYWVHNGLLQVKDEKMSKSLGNFISINDVLREHPKEVVRFFILSTHYRSPVDYSPEKIGEARRGWERLNGIYQRLAKFLAGQGFDGGGNWQEIEVNELSPGERQLREAMEEGQENFIGAMEDDFNTALAMAALFQLGREINSFLTNLQPPYGTATLGLLAGALGIMQELGGQILGIFPPVEEGSNEAFNDVLQILLDVRTEAKKKKDYATADAIRDRLREVGIILEDTPQGVNWHWA